MSVVYAAHDLDLDRAVAIKLLRPQPQPQEQEDVAPLRQRLVREAQAMARLSHPNVVQVYEVGLAGDQVFIAMELVDGRTLRNWVVEEKPDWRTIVGAYRQAAQALAAAHAVGIVHRDFKPDNALIDRDGRVRVLDFGLARSGTNGPQSQADRERSLASQIGAVTSLTRTGALVGTPAYMAPEQFRGEPVDERTDIFNFCAALYESIYGQPAFAGDSLAERFVAVLENRRSPIPAGSRVPSRLHAVLLRGMAHAAKERPTSMTELIEALAKASRPRTQRLRIPVVVALALVALALLSTTRIHRPVWRADVRELGLAYDENSDWSDFSPDGTRLAYSADRGDGWRVYVAPVGGGPDHALTPPSPNGYELAKARWTRDGKAILYTVWNGSSSASVTLSIADGRIEEIAPGAREAEDCAGGLLLLFKGAPGCPDCGRLVVRADGDEREIFHGAPGINLKWARCDRASMLVVFGMGDAPVPSSHRALYLIGFDGRGLRKLFDNGKRSSFPFFHPDGRSVLFSTDMLGDGQAIWELPVGGGKPEYLAGDGFALAPAVSPDGRYLTFNSDATPSRSLK
jgi:serine/threonine protein kinase